MMGAIASKLTGDNKDSYYFMLLTAGNCLARYQWQKLLIMQVVANAVNAIYCRQGQLTLVNGLPLFEWGKNAEISNEKEDKNQCTREIQKVEVHSMQDNGCQPVHNKRNVPKGKAGNQIKKDSSDQSSIKQSNNNQSNSNQSSNKCKLSKDLNSYYKESNEGKNDNQELLHHITTILGEDKGVDKT